MKRIYAVLCIWMAIGWNAAIADGFQGMMMGVFSSSFVPTWNISLATYASKSCALGTQNTAPRGFWLDASGTRLYTADATGENIYQYTLSTPFDMSTCSYASKSFNTTAQAANPRDIILNSAGTSAYILDGATWAVYQFTLGTAWDISTASYASKSLALDTQNPSGINAIAADSTLSKFFVQSVAAGHTVYQYNLTVAGDLATGSYASKSLDTNALVSTSGAGAAFGNGGSAFYIGNISTGILYQYTVSTPFDISTATSASHSLNVGSQDANPSQFRFPNSGLYAYVLGSVGKVIYQYNMQ